MPSPASRLDAIPPYLFQAIAAAKRKAIAEGRDVIDLGIGDPDQPTPAPIIAALADAVRNPMTHRYDESGAGWTPFLDAASGWLERRFGVRVDPATGLMLLIGSKEGLAHLAWAYLEPGDVALVPSPGYPVYRVNALLAGADVYEMPLTADGSFLPDLAAIPPDISRRAKLLFLNYPNNPTGATASLDFFSQAVAFARQHDILLVSDAAYSEVTLSGEPQPSVLQVDGASDVAIELHSLSKMYNMTGWRIGFAAGNPAAVATLNRLKSNLDSRQFPAISEAAAHALLHVDNSATLALYLRRRDILCGRLARAGWDITYPNATFYVWARIPGGGDDAEFARALLERASVNVVPGSGYGTYGRGYVRMSLTVLGDRDGERITEAAERIAGCLQPA